MIPRRRASRQSLGQHAPVLLEDPAEIPRLSIAAGAGDFADVELSFAQEEFGLFHADLDNQFSLRDPQYGTHLYGSGGSVYKRRP